MKILKYLLIVILGLVVLFVALGLFNPSIKYGHEIAVTKSIKEAWAIQQDATKLKLWLKGFKSINHLSGTLGEVGSKYKVVVNPGEGQPDFEMIETITSLKEHDHISLDFDSDMMRFNQTTSFSQSNGKTTIKTESEVKGKGLMMQSMFAVMELFGGAFEKQEIKNVEALKKVIENDTTDYYPTQPSSSEPLKSAAKAIQ